MSTTPQMSQIGQQQGQQFSPQQQYGPEQFGQQQPFGQQGQGYGQQFGQQQSGQQGPSTAPPQPGQIGQQGQPGQIGQIGQQRQFGQQIPGQQQIPPHLQQQMPQQMQQQIPQHLRQQMQQLGQQQPFQQLLQQLGQERVPQAQAPAISTQALTGAVAQSFWDVVQPLPGQASLLYLHVDNEWRVYVNPDDRTRDQVQEAFAYGQPVIGYYDTNNPGLLLAIVITR